MRISAWRDDEGAVWTLWLRAGTAGLELHDEADGANLALPPSLVFGAFARYGKPIEPAAIGDQPTAAAVLVEADGRCAQVRGFRFVAFGDAHPTDWIALEEAGRPTLAVPALLLGGALAALAKAGWSAS